MKQQKVQLSKKTKLNRRVILILIIALLIAVALVLGGFGYKAYKTNQEKIQKQRTEQTERQRAEEAQNRGEIPPVRGSTDRVEVVPIFVP